MHSLSWLHISDLHFGSEGHDWYWPNLKEHFCKDLEKHFRKYGACDLVLFTGDITYSGQASQFASFSSEFASVLDCLSSQERRPILLAVPGNHDMKRPNRMSAIVRALSRFSEDIQLQREFWTNSNSEYHDLLGECYAEYTAWIESCPFPRPSNIQEGFLPGDFSAVIEKDGKRYGFVGLNTAFLQLDHGDYERRMFIHEKQLIAICGSDPNQWIRENHYNFLLTHHPVGWLSEKAQESYHGEICPAGRFLIHFCGHLHKPSSFSYVRSGAKPRRVWHAPSLFGLRNFGHEQEERIHGYSFGHLTIGDTEAHLAIWPRLSHRTYDGGYHIVADPGYELDEDNSSVESLPLNSEIRIPVPGEFVDEAATVSDDELLARQISIVDEQITPSLAKERLSGVSKTVLPVCTQDKRVRLQEQTAMQRMLSEIRLGYLVCDWGLGKNSFLGTVWERFTPAGELPEAYLINCASCFSREDFLDGAKKQTGMSFEHFSLFIAALDQCLLIFDDVESSVLIEPEKQETPWLSILVNSLLDLAPTLHIVIVCRSLSSVSPYDTVRLKPLTLPEVINYCTDHQDSPADILSPDTIEAVYLRSEGIPMHLERIIKELKYCSIEETLDGQHDLLARATESGEPVPPALVRAVQSLYSTSDKYSQRSLRLLKVLTVLSSGAPLRLIKHFYPTDPFWPRNAEELGELGLLESIPLTNPASEIGLAASLTLPIELRSAKLLLVPRQIRDYLSTLVSDDERNRIVHRAAELLFGVGWHQGTAKLSPTTRVLARKTETINFDNEHLVIRQLLLNAISADNRDEAEKVLRLASAYYQELDRADRFHDLYHSSLEIMQLAARLVPLPHLPHIKISFGKAARMIGKRQEALAALEDAVRNEDRDLPKDSLARAWLNIALAYDTNGEKEDAASAARQVLDLTDKGSGLYLHATAVIFGNTLDGEEMQNKLKSLEKEARKKNHIIVANNIALDLASQTADSDSADKLRNRVIQSGTDSYNRIRGVIAKAESLRKKERLGDLTAQERNLLSTGYSYLYGQRLTSLFNNCHSILWALLTAENKIVQLLRMFRISSFMWRIRGEEKQEKRYLLQLQSRTDISSDKTKGLRADSNELRYFEIRRASVLPEANNK